MPASAVVPGTYPYLHFPVWYQAAKGGQTGFSFGVSYASLARLRQRPLMNPAEEWMPERFSWDGEAGAYDAFVVRAAGEAARGRLDARSTRLAAQAGTWWLYLKQPDGPLRVR